MIGWIQRGWNDEFPALVSNEFTALRVYDLATPFSACVRKDTVNGKKHLQRIESNGR